MEMTLQVVTTTKIFDFHDDDLRRSYHEDQGQPSVLQCDAIMTTTRTITEDDKYPLIQPSMHVSIQGQKTLLTVN